MRACECKSEANVFSYCRRDEKYRLSLPWPSSSSSSQQWHCINQVNSSLCISLRILFIQIFYVRSSFSSSNLFRRVSIGRLPPATSTVACSLRWGLGTFVCEFRSDAQTEKNDYNFLNNYTKSVCALLSWRAFELECGLNEANVRCRRESSAVVAPAVQVSTFSFCDRLSGIGDSRKFLPPNANAHDCGKSMSSVDFSAGIVRVPVVKSTLRRRHYI